jgi:hypothetical protein
VKAAWVPATNGRAEPIPQGWPPAERPHKSVSAFHQENVMRQRRNRGHDSRVLSVSEVFRGKSIRPVMQSSAFDGKDTGMRNRRILMLCVAATALSTSHGNAGPCTREIDREWAEVGARIQARIGAGRSNIQGTVGLLHHQPTPSSIAAAEEKVGDRWVPLEAAVMALARAREADHANDAGSCKEALMAVQHAIVR